MDQEEFRKHLAEELTKYFEGSGVSVPKVYRFDEWMKLYTEKQEEERE